MEKLRFSSEYTGCDSSKLRVDDESNRIPETLPEEVLAKMHAPPKPDYPVIQPSELVNFDAFIFGIPTRYGNFPGQWKVSRLYNATLRSISHLDP